MSAFIWLVIGVGAAAMLYNIAKRSVYVVEEKTVIVVKRWGRHHRILGPGLHFRLIRADSLHRTYDARRSFQTIMVIADCSNEQSVAITCDLELRGILSRQSIQQYTYELDDSQGHLGTMATRVCRELVRLTTYEELLADTKLGKKLHYALADKVIVCGYELVEVHVTSIRQCAVQDAPIPPLVVSRARGTAK